MAYGLLLKLLQVFKQISWRIGILGIANPDLGSGAAHHNSRFDVDESALLLGVCAELSFALR